MIKTEIKQLVAHIKALQKGYDNILLLLSEDIKMVVKDDVESIALKDDKIKTYADGIDKLSESLDKQRDRIKVKQAELLKLQNPEKHKEKIAKKTEKEHGNSNLNKHLDG
ncbi:MAG: hypothetical protein QM499_00940 [Flavobacteriaceae bacterium]